MVWLLAQGPAGIDGVLGGMGGWVGTGLLGAVLGWLLFSYLPAKDKQLSEFMKNKDDHVKEILASYRAETALAREKTDAQFVRQQDHDRNNMKVIAESLLQLRMMTGSLVEAVTNLTNKISGLPPRSVTT